MAGVVGQAQLSQVEDVRQWEKEGRLYLSPR